MLNGRDANTIDFNRRAQMGVINSSGAGQNLIGLRQINPFENNARVGGSRAQGKSNLFAIVHTYTGSANCCF